MNYYKLRLECLHDGLEIIKANEVIRWKLVAKQGKFSMPSCTLEINTKLSIEEIGKIINSSAPDLHVAVESLKLKKEYDGERNGPLSDHE